MSSEQEFADSIFAWRFAKKTNAKQVADAASAVWRDINIGLSPVIGQRGVIALLKRSVHLEQANFPALKTMHGLTLLPGEFSALHSVLAQQTSTHAVLMNSALLNRFYELLSNLIGASLSHQLLHSVFDTSSGGDSDPIQDTLS